MVGEIKKLERLLNGGRERGREKFDWQEMDVAGGRLKWMMREWYVAGGKEGEKSCEELMYVEGGRLKIEPGRSDVEGRRETKIRGKSPYVKAGGGGERRSGGGGML